MRIISPKKMTVERAIRMERGIVEIAKRSKTVQDELRKAIQIFRKSGGWAITPEHHRTFSKWCMFIAAKVGVSGYTLMSYSSPNYDRNERKRALEAGDVIMFTGEAARLLKRCVLIACAANGHPTNRRRTKWAGIKIAQYFLDGHELYAKKIRKMRYIKHKSEESNKIPWVKGKVA